MQENILLILDGTDVCFGKIQVTCASNRLTFKASIYDSPDEYEKENGKHVVTQDSDLSLLQDKVRAINPGCITRFIAYYA